MTDSLAQARDALSRATDATGVTDDTMTFLDAVLAIARGGASAHTQAEPFLRETAPVLPQAIVPLHAYIRELETLASNEAYGDEWVKLCEGRSRVEAVRELYRDLAPVSWVSFMNVEDLDDGIRARGDADGGGSESDIPAGTPSSHWWWWYPAAPPA